MDLDSFFAAYLYAARYSNLPEYYGQWITIGGRPEGNKRHAGGTPVYVDDDGRIVRGPSTLRNKTLAELAQEESQKETLGQAELPIGKRPRINHPAPAYQTLFPFIEERINPEAEPEPRGPRGRRERQERGQFIPPTVERHPDGRITGHALMSVDDLSVDPARFQYKFKDVDPKTGTTAELKEVQRFRPEFAGQLLVWRDPKDGKNYVINGHHRYELAKRSGYNGPIPVYFIDAKTESEARALGALANIAEGRGTAVDAAKFMRESGLGPEDLKEQGISLKGDMARKAAILKNLTPHLFNELVMERLSEPQALVIATHLYDQPDLQEQLFHQMEKRGRFSTEELDEVAREMRDTAMTSKQMTLFGEEEERRSYIWEKAAIKAHIRRRIAEQLRAFSTVAQERKADILESAGNVIAREQNERIRQQLAEAQWLFDLEANKVGPFSAMLNRYAQAMAESPRRKREILQQAWDEAVEMLGLPTKKEEREEELAPMLFSRWADNLWTRHIIDPPGLRDDYVRGANPRWITIGGHPEGDKKHVGGVHVQIDDDGRIIEGPPN